MKKRNLLLNLLMLIVLTTSCNKPSNEQVTAAYTQKGDTVFISDSSILKSKVKIAEVEEIPFAKEVITAGTIQPIPTQFAYIAPPFSGRVTKSYIKLGQKVAVNTPLFEIISPDFTTAQKEFFKSLSERDLARKDMKRKEDLIKNGVSSQKEQEEAANALHIAEKEYENAYAAIKLFQADPENMVLGQPLIIRSPIAGNIIENNLVTGQFLNNDTEHVAIVADLSKVWVTAQVKEKDIRFINVGDEMDIHMSALPEKSIMGKVFHIDEAIDEETRSIKVLSVCDNQQGLLKLGMYATVHFLDKPASVISIPEKALLQSENTSYVFVQSAPNTFIKTPVEVEVTRDGKAIIVDGLKKGDIIISEGGYYLK